MNSLLKFTLMGILAASLPVATATTELKDETVKVEQSQDVLVTIKDDISLSPKERAEKEISARRDIVLSALTLSLAEVGSIRASLAKLPEFSPESREKELQDKFISELDGFGKYYSEKFEQVKGIQNPTLDEIKAIAQEIIDYRETTYNDAVKQIINFALYFYNNDVIATAGIRLEKISADINKLEKLNLLKVGISKESLDKAALLISEAAVLQRQAGELILAVPPVSPAPEDEENSEVIDETIEAPAETPAETPNPLVVSSSNPNTLIVESLNKIRSAYEIFLQISRDIRASLGL